VDTTELCFTPATELGRLIRGRALSPVELVDAVLAPTMVDRLAFTFPFNLTGQPAATVPCGFTAEGLPVGLQIVGLARRRDRPSGRRRLRGAPALGGNPAAARVTPHPARGALPPPRVRSHRPSG